MTIVQNPVHVGKQFETDETFSDPIRVFREDGWMVGGTVDGTEEAVDVARQDAQKRRRRAHYYGNRPGDLEPVYMDIRQLSGEFQALIVRDPRNPGASDYDVMDRFYDPEEAEVA